MSIIPATMSVNMDELAYSLSELDQLSPDGVSWKRFQIITVPRNDKLVEWRRDMGNRNKFAAPQFRIPGGVREDDGSFVLLHTVGELVDMADYMRGHPTIHNVRKHDLIEGYGRYKEEENARH